MNLFLPQGVRSEKKGLTTEDLTLGREGTALASGDRKYSENLGSTIEEHRLCHFRSSTIEGVTKVVSEHGYTMMEWDLFQMFFESKSTEASLNGWTVLTDVTIIRLEFATLMVGFTTVLLGVTPEPYKPELFNICLELSVGGRDGSTVVQDDGHTCTFLFATRHLEAYDGKKKLRPKDTKERLNRLRFKNYFKELRSSWTDFKSSRSSISTQGMGPTKDSVYGVSTVRCLRQGVHVELIIYNNFSIEICCRVNLIHRLWIGE
ncbi:hypothetical protein DY000_02030198 [Brassica cretica]|uniref:Uncharacterized protein n=1 Tax=Brassica cretica TaxID=69181 RepID=A0ABQ7DF65_BRACR|nr:hypothetical protein DY000_02030198 [Brassica cretica]